MYLPPCLLSGTSMSTPAAAGAATLVRQYFMDGFYPTGAPVPGHAYQPSASLIRAVIVAGAETMTGIAVATGRRLVQPPKSPHQGYGRLHLGRSLPLANSSLGWNLTVVDRAVFNDTSVNHTYTVTATGQGPLIVVLSYVDWPGFPSSQRALVNDLNLVVRWVAITAEGCSRRCWSGTMCSLTGDAVVSGGSVHTSAPVGSNMICHCCSTLSIARTHPHRVLAVAMLGICILMADGNRPDCTAHADVQGPRRW
jgi:hypothetical protein